MPEPFETPSEADGALFGQVADEVADRLRRGERPDLSDYARRHPRIAKLILEGLPLLEVMGRKPDPDPERLGEYQIVQRIGRGGMATVYEAREPALGRSVALKVLAASVAADPSAVERFRREARAVALLHHTNIVPVFAVGEAGGAHFFAMQLIRGRSLRDALVDPAGGGLGPPGSADYYRGAARIGYQVAEALAHAHGHGVVHRDVKPSNVLTDDSGTAWLTDFGLAKVRGLGELTRDGEIVGTLRFLAPECFRGEADARADVYGLGMTLYELVARRLAFDESDRERLLWQITHAEPPRPRAVDPHVPRDLETIVRKAIAKEPAARYASARDLADDLRRFLDGRPVVARRPSAIELAGRWARRHPLPAGLAACVFLLLATLAIGATVTAVRLDDRSRQISANLDRAVRAEADARAASDREAEAKRAALRRAWEAMVAEAALTRGSPTPGRRAAALARLTEAAGLLPEVPHDVADVRRLRDLVTATLLTPDLVPGPAWERPPLTGVRVLGFDKAGRCALGTRDGEIHVLRDPDGPPDWTGRVPLGARSGLSYVVFSPDGHSLAVFIGPSVNGSSQLAVFHDRQTEPMFRQSDVVSATFSPDSRLLACVRGDRTVELYCLDNGVGPPTRLSDLRVNNFAFAPDGGRYACVDISGTRILVRATATHDQLDTFPVREGTAAGLAWLSDGRHLVVPSPTAITVCDARTGLVVRRLTCAGGFDPASPVACSGGWLAAVGKDGAPHVWDVGAGGEPCVSAPAVSVNRNRVAAFAGSNLVTYQLDAWQRFRFEPAAEYRRLGVGYKYETLPASLPTDGRWLAVLAESVVYLWDLVAGAAVAVPTGPADAVLAEPDGSGLYVLGVDGGSARLRQWPVRFNEDGVGPQAGEPAEVGLPAVLASPVRGSLAMSPDGRFVALAVTVGQPVPAGLAKGAGPSQRLFRPAFATTLLADLRAGRWTGPSAVIPPIGPEYPAPRPRAFGRQRLALGPDARWLALAQPDGPVPAEAASAPSVFWDLSQTPPAAATARYADGLPRQVAFSPDGRWLIEGARIDYFVRSPATWEVVTRLPGDPAGRRAAPAAFSPDGRLLAVVQSRRAVTLYRTGTWDEVAALPMRPEDGPHWLGFTADGSRLVAVSASAVHIWDLGRIRARWRELGIDVESPS
jgi:WD40 repeat protein